MKALTLSEYILWSRENFTDGSEQLALERADMVDYYCNFLSQPFDVGMLAICERYLCEPDRKDFPEHVFDSPGEAEQMYQDACVVFAAAGEKILFDGWTAMWDSCDCGGGYPCAHPDWVYEFVHKSGVKIWHEEKEYFEMGGKSFSFPLTLGDFISDCTRAGIPLEFTDKVAEQYFK